MSRRRVVVTGASSGIGEATARLFAERGWEVIAVARRADRLAALAERDGISFVVADLTSDEDVAALRDRLAADGAIHALVNNAGGALGADSVESSSLDDWRWMFEINVLATKRVVTALLPLLREGARELGSADLLTVTSTAAFSPYKGGAGYNAAKAGEKALVDVLRLELNGEPIRVIEVAPGLVATEEFSLVRFRGDSDKRDAVYDGVADPLTAEDVAVTIVDALERPAHVNQDLIVLRPVAQASTTLLHRGELRVADPA